MSTYKAVGESSLDFPVFSSLLFFSLLGVGKQQQQQQPISRIRVTYKPLAPQAIPQRFLF
jgi:hypothetical protein